MLLPSLPPRPGGAYKMREAVTTTTTRARAIFRRASGRGRARASGIESAGKAGSERGGGGRDSSSRRRRIGGGGNERPGKQSVSLSISLFDRGCVRGKVKTFCEIVWRAIITRLKQEGRGGGERALFERASSLSRSRTSPPPSPSSVVRGRASER